MYAHGEPKPGEVSPVSVYRSIELATSPIDHLQYYCTLVGILKRVLAVPDRTARCKDMNVASGGSVCVLPASVAIQPFPYVDSVVCASD